MVRTYLLNVFFFFFSPRREHQTEGGTLAKQQKKKKEKNQNSLRDSGSDRSEEDSAHLEHGPSPIAPSRHFHQTQGELFQKNADMDGLMVCLLLTFLLTVSKHLARNNLRKKQLIFVYRKTQSSLMSKASQQKQEDDWLVTWSHGYIDSQEAETGEEMESDYKTSRLSQ